MAIITNIGTVLTTVRDKMNQLHDIAPGQSITIANQDLDFSEIEDGISKGWISVTGYSDVTQPGSGYSITQTIFPVTATSQQLLAANTSRRYLSWMIIGTQDVTIVAGSGPAVVGQGIVYQAGGSGKQGASQEFPNGAPSNAFQCIASGTGSSVIVWEGV
jgi:hypothetical protein